MKKILLYCIPAIVSVIATCTGDLIDLKFGIGRMTLVGMNFDKATELYGVFTNQYQKILNMALAITATLPTVLIPAVSASSTLGGNEYLKSKINESIKFVFIITIPFAVVLAVLAKPIISFVFFSMSLNQGDDLMMLGSWVVVAMSVIYVQTATFIGIGKPYLSSINMIIGMAFKILINYFLVAIPCINIKGAVLGTLVAFLITCILNNIFLKKHLSISIKYWNLMYKPIISSLLMATVAYLVYIVSKYMFSAIINSNLLLNDICVILALVIGGIVYLIVLIHFKAINKNDIIKLPMGRRLNSFLQTCFPFE